MENLTQPVKALEIAFILSADLLIYTYTYIIMSFA
jgi:hypothetical protein